MKYLIIDKRQRVKIEGDLPYASSRIIEELKKKNLEFDFAYFDQIEILYKGSNLEILINKKHISEYSHILFRGHPLGEKAAYETKTLIADYIEELNTANPTKKTSMLNLLATQNLPYYNKIWMARICTKNGIPFFDSYYRADGEYAMKRESLTSYPIIIKECSGENDVRTVENTSKIKKNVFKLENSSDYNQEFLKDKDLKNFFLQEYSDSGEDMRIFVSKHQVIGGWKRKATKGFMTVSQGEYTLYNDPKPEIKDLAIRTSKAFKADFIATDFMYKDGKPYLQEISLHPGFKAYEEKAEGGEPANIAKAIIESF